MEQDEAIDLVRRHVLKGVWYIDYNEEPDDVPSGHYDDTIWIPPDYEEGFRSVLQGPNGDVLVAACKQLLTDPDITVRSGIVAVVNQFASHVGAEFLENKLKSHSHLFLNVEPVGVTLKCGYLDKEIIAAIQELREARVSLEKKQTSVILGVEAQNQTTPLWVSSRNRPAPTYHWRLFSALLLGCFSFALPLILIWFCFVVRKVYIVHQMNTQKIYDKAWLMHGKTKDSVMSFLGFAFVAFLWTAGVFIFFMLDK